MKKFNNHFSTLKKHFMAIAAVFLFNGIFIPSYAQWVIESSPLPGADEYYQKVVSSENFNRDFAITFDFNSSTHKLRVNTGTGTPFSFGSSFDVEYFSPSNGIQQVNSLLGMNIFNNRLYIVTEYGVGVWNVSNALPTSGTITLTDASSDEVPNGLGKELIVVEDLTNPGLVTYIVNSGTFLEYKTPLGLTFTSLTFSSFTASNVITCMEVFEEAGQRYLIIGTSNGGNISSNPNMVGVFELGDDGQPSLMSWSDVILTGGSNQYKRNVLSMAIVNDGTNKRLYIGTGTNNPALGGGVLYSDYLIHPEFNVATDGLGNTFSVGARDRRITTMVAYRQDLYIGTINGVGYNPTALADQTWIPYTFGNNSEPTILSVKKRSTDLSLYTSSDATTLRDLYKTRILPVGCAVSASILGPTSGCKAGSTFSSSFSACSGLGIVYQWSGTAGTTISTPTSSSTLISFANDGTPYTITLNIRGTGYGLNATAKLTHYTNTTPTIPTVQLSRLGSGVTLSYSPFNPSVLNSQRVNGTWTRGNGNKVVAIANIGSAPAMPTVSNINSRIISLGDGTFAYGSHAALNSSGQTVGFIVYIGSGSNLNAIVPLANPLTVQGSGNANIGIRAIEVNHNGCFTNFASTSPTKYPSPVTTCLGCRTSTTGDNLEDITEAVDKAIFYTYTNEDKLFLSSNLGYYDLEHVQVYDLTGKLILTLNELSGTNDIEINTSNPNTRMYLLRIKPRGDEWQSLRVIK